MDGGAWWATVHGVTKSRTRLSNLIYRFKGAFLVAQLVKNDLQCGRPGFDLWAGKTPGEGNGYPLQYSGLENSMDCIIHEVAKSRTRLSEFYFHFSRDGAD